MCLTTHSLDGMITSGLPIALCITNQKSCSTKENLNKTQTSPDIGLLFIFLSDMKIRYNKICISDIQTNINWNLK